jgi:hypothetical protein
MSLVECAVILSRKTLLHGISYFLCAFVCCCLGTSISVSVFVRRERFYVEIKFVASLLEHVYVICHGPYCINSRGPVCTCNQYM